VTPAAAGLQVVRVSFPLPPGFLGTNQACAISVTSGALEPAALRVLSWHPATNAAARTARRALVTFTPRFANTNPVKFVLQPARSSEATPADFPVTLLAEGESFTLAWKDGRKMDLKFIAPPRAPRESARLESVEENHFFRWQRLHFPDAEWPRIIEFRFDTAGAVVAVGHLQRGTTNDCYAPEMGWELRASALWAGLSAVSAFQGTNGGQHSRSFASGEPVTCLLDGGVALYHPTAPLKRRGKAELVPDPAGRWTYRYLRCQAGDKVPMQPKAWQRAEVLLAPQGLARLTPFLNSPHRVEPNPNLWAALYGDADPLPKLPVSYDKLASRMDYPLSWLHGGHRDFAAWRQKARVRVVECLLTPPPAAPFEPKIVAEQDRGSYVARKVVFNVSGDSRVLAFLLVPKSAGPHPAVLLFHDHGAKFDIGKEKVIEPWDAPPEKIESARNWVTQCYGGRFIGDELARRGYVCFATDMLNWSHRGGGGYENQQALAANLFQLGASWAGLIAHEDLRAAEFLATRPEVDGKRVAAMGLSVGGFRTWQTAALSDRIAAGVSVCWMATCKGLIVPGNNQTGGQSAFTMIHPGLAQQLDYPDVASIACPKPMMFLCGKQDKLFPVESIEAAFARMQKVWQSQQASERLVTRLYDAPHEYNAAMQDEAFAWLDRQFKPVR